MLGTGYFLKITKINFQQEKPLCPNRKNWFPQNTKKKRQSAKINSRKKFVLHGLSWSGVKLCVDQKSEYNQIFWIKHLDLTAIPEP